MTEHTNATWMYYIAFTSQLDVCEVCRSAGARMRVKQVCVCCPIALIRGTATALGWAPAARIWLEETQDLLPQDPQHKPVGLNPCHIQAFECSKTKEELSIVSQRSIIPSIATHTTAGADIRHMRVYLCGQHEFVLH